jgi:hypothetical protein
MKKIIILIAVLIMGLGSYAQKEPVKLLNPQTAQSGRTPNIIKPEIITKVAFEAIIATPQSSPRSPLRFDGVRYNDGNAFSASENAFIVPTAGLYFLSVNLTWNGYGCEYADGGASVSLLKNGRETVQSINQAAPNNNVGAFSSILSFSTKLSAGDKLTILVINTLCTTGGGSVPILKRAVFSGYRVYAD